MTILALKSLSAQACRATLAMVAPVAGCLLIAGCSAASSPPRQIASEAPHVTYTYKGDRELVAANDKAVTYCSQYHAVPHTLTIDDAPNGNKEVTFDCVASLPATVGEMPSTTVPSTTVTSTTVPSTTAESDLNSPYQTDQELLDASRRANTYCINSGSQRATPILVTNVDGTKTVNFQCVP